MSMDNLCWSCKQPLGYCRCDEPKYIFPKMTREEEHTCEWNEGGGFCNVCIQEGKAQNKKFEMMYNEIVERYNKANKDEIKFLEELKVGEKLDEEAIGQVANQIRERIAKLKEKVK